MRRPPPGYRRGARPIYPGVFKMLVYGFILWALALLGIELPFELPRWLFLVLEVAVIWLLWKGVRAARRAPRNQVRLFSAQEHWVNAFALQALILFLW
jgi:membrane protein implicated in regulation of membrane protease activity